MTRRRRWSRFVPLGAGALVLLVYAAGESYRARDGRTEIMGWRGVLIRAETTSSENLGGSRYRSLTLGNERGVVTTARIRTPADSSARHPAVVILGGLRTGQRTVDYLEDTRDVVLMALDYPYAGKRERLGAGEFVAALPEMRRAVMQTVAVIWMGVDYLLTRDDVDPGRIILVGGSLGALFVPAAAAMDERIAAVAVLFGAGDIERLLRANLGLPGWAAAPAAWWGAVLSAPIEPLDYIADVSPRPLLMLNGIGDARMPVECSRRLHEKARKPKTVGWIDVGHLNVRDREFHGRVRTELDGWFDAQGLIARRP